MMWTTLTLVSALLGCNCIITASLQGFVEMESKIGHMARPDFVKLERANSALLHEVFIDVKQINMEVLESSALSRNTPGSPLYRQWMTSEEVGAIRNNPVGANIISDWLTTNSVEITWESVSKTYFKAVTTVGHWEELLQTSFHMYEDQKEGSGGRKLPRAETYFIPSSISDHVHAFFEVSELPATMSRHSRTSKVPIERHSVAVDKNNNLRVRELAGACTGEATIDCLNEVYEVSSNLGNADATQSVFETSTQSFSPTDLTYGATVQAAVDVGGHSVSSCSLPAGNCDEGNLDIQYIMGLAQISVSTFYYVPSSGDPFVSLAWC